MHKFMAAIIALAAFAYLLPLAPAIAQSTSTQNSTTAKWRQLGRQVRLSDFNKMENGKSYAQVCKLLGTVANDTSGTDPKIVKIMEQMTVKPGVLTYVWRNQDGSNLNAMFQYGRLISKSQSGLK